MTPFVFSLDTLAEAAHHLLAALEGHRVAAFRGAMGAGKTTLIKALCAELGVADMVTSPTFAIINEYRDGRGEPVYHFDCYRLRSAAEALDIGIDDYLSSGSLCLIEWPGIVEPLLPDDTLFATIESLPDGRRRLSL